MIKLHSMNILCRGCDLNLHSMNILCKGWDLKGNLGFP